MEQAQEAERQLEEIQVSIDEAKLAIKDRDDLLGLMQDKRFKRIIMEKYLQEEPVRLVMLKGAGLREEERKRVDNMMYGLSALDNYFRQVIQMGNQMEAALRDDEQTREEILKAN